MRKATNASDKTSAPDDQRTVESTHTLCAVTLLEIWVAARGAPPDKTSTCDAFLLLY